jgi:hypothetical protein
MDCGIKYFSAPQFGYHKQPGKDPAYLPFQKPASNQLNLINIEIPPPFYRLGRKGILQHIC